jgi:hypothetical protein
MQKAFGREPALHDMFRVKHEIYGLANHVADSEKKLCSFVPQFLPLSTNTWVEREED